MFFLLKGTLPNFSWWYKSHQMSRSNLCLNIQNITSDQMDNINLTRQSKDCIEKTLCNVHLLHSFLLLAVLRLKPLFIWKTLKISRKIASYMPRGNFLAQHECNYDYAPAQSWHWVSITHLMHLTHKSSFWKLKDKIVGLPRKVNQNDWPSNF